MKNHHNGDKETAKNQSMIDHHENSRYSVGGFMETGNPAEAQQKARMMRNENNRTETVES